MKKILVIEPLVEVRNRIVHELETPYVELVFVDNTDEALLYIESSQVDEVISGFEPPYMLCFDFARLLSQRGKEIAYKIYSFDLNSHIYERPIVSLQKIDNLLNFSLVKNTSANKVATVLFADGSDDEHLLIERLLRELHPNIIHSYEARDVVDDFKMLKESNKEIDLILLDLEMPGDGLQVCQEMRKIEEVSRFRATPIYALTSNANDESLERCGEKDGFTGYIYRPRGFEYSDLFALLHH